MYQAKVKTDDDQTKYKPGFYMTPTNHRLIVVITEAENDFRQTKDFKTVAIDVPSGKRGLVKKIIAARQLF